VGTLSNFVKGANPDGPDRGDGAPAEAAASVCRPARPDELHAALRLVLSAAGRPADNNQVLDFMQFAAQRGIDTRDLWVCQRDGHLLWAVLPIVSPGRTMLLFTGAERPDPADTGRLVDAVCH